MSGEPSAKNDGQEEGFGKGVDQAGREQVLRNQKLVPGGGRSPGQVTETPVSSPRNPSLKLQPTRPNRKADTVPMTLDEAKQEEWRVS